MEVIGGEGTGIAVNADAFSTDKVIFTEEHLKSLSTQVEQFLMEI